MVWPFSSSQAVGSASSVAGTEAPKASRLSLQDWKISQTAMSIVKNWLTPAFLSLAAVAGAAYKRFVCHNNKAAVALTGVSLAMAGLAYYVFPRQKAEAPEGKKV